MKDNTFLAGTIIVAALIIAGALVYVFDPARTVGAPSGDKPAVTLPPFETSLPYSQTAAPGEEVLLGNPAAPVEIVEYGDYQCPFCGRFASQTESRIRDNYVASGKVKMIYKDLIVVDGFVSDGHESTDAALAANCAAPQGKFWEYHDALFAVEAAEGNKENNGNLNRGLFMAIAKRLKIDEESFANCYDLRKYIPEIESDTGEAKKELSQLSTPSVFVNGELVPGGARPYEDFASVIDKFLK